MSKAPQKKAEAPKKKTQASGQDEVLALLRRLAAGPPSLTAGASSQTACDSVSLPSISSSTPAVPAVADPISIPRPVALLAGLTRMSNLPPDRAAYWGKFNTRGGFDPFVMELGTMVDLISSGSGVITQIVTNNPSTFSFSGLGYFNQVRILAMKLKYQPVNRYQPSLALTVPIASKGIPLAVLADYGDTTTTVSSYIAAAANTTVALENTQDPFTFTARMNGTPDANWQSAAGATAATFAIKFYGDSGSNSLVYGKLYIQALAQFMC